MKYVEVVYSRKHIEEDYRQFASYEELDEWLAKNKELGITIEIDYVKEVEL